MSGEQERALSFVWRMGVLLPILLLSGCIFSSPANFPGTEYSFAKSQLIEAEFVDLAAFAEEFRLSNDRIPTSDELDAHIDESGEGYYQRIRYSWTSQANGDCYGRPPPTSSQDEYILCMWRGDWEEWYNPRTGETSLPQSIEEYGASTNFKIGWAIVVLLVLYLLVPRRWRPFWPKGKEK